MWNVSAGLSVRVLRLSIEFTLLHPCKPFAHPTEKGDFIGFGESVDGHVCDRF